MASFVSNGDAMILDSSPSEASKRSQANDKVCEKGIEKGSFQVGNLNRTGNALVLDSSPIELSMESHASEDCREGTDKGGGLVLGNVPVEDLDRPKVNEVREVLDSSSAEANERDLGKQIEKGGALGLGDVPVENLNRPEVSGESMILDGCPSEASKSFLQNGKDHGKGIEKGVACVLNNSLAQYLNQPKVHGNVSTEASKQLQGSLTDCEKKTEKLGNIVLCKVPAEGLNCPDLCVDTMHIDNSPTEASNQSQLVRDHDKRVGKPLKRKRASVDGNVTSKDREFMVTEYHRELDGLFEYYKEFSTHKLNLEAGMCASNNSLFACLLEESTLPFSKLVKEVYEKLRAREGVTLASVRSALLSVGQRMMYGITKADADVLEDESESCLWCWETRDLKLLPASQRGILNVRRMGRKKIHERISALSGILSALSVPESDINYKSDLSKASVKLRKALNGEGIRSLVEKLKEKNDSDMAEKEAKLKEKELVKETERNMRNAEKEKRRMEREIEKEKWHSEKESKKLEEEAQKEERRRQKEEAEMKKQFKKQQEEAERDQRHREKAEAEMRKQLAIQKQATIMERFLKSKKSNKSDNPDKESCTKGPISSSCKEEVFNATTTTMDCAFSQQESLSSDDLRKLHIAAWHKLSRHDRSCHWGVRRSPKIKLFKELKLHASPSEAEPLEKVGMPDKGFVSYKENNLGEPSLDKLVVGRGDTPENNLGGSSPSARLLSKKLLQFDKSHRPAYYGTWHKKSGVIGPRHPFKKDLDLDYDVDSDEEWEEEEPGESLSDCEKDNEEDHLEEENSKLEDEDESEDDFVVPDGYLSENEGVQVDSSSDGREDEARSLSCKSEVVSEEIRALLQQCKNLDTLTEQALRKGHPLIISNLMHERSEEMIDENLSATHKLEQICLQALSMRVCPEGSIVDISVNLIPSGENLEAPLSQNNSNAITSPGVPTIEDSDLPEFVFSIQSNPHGINKVVENLQLKFPNTPKSRLRNKVKEISDFVDNRWQVKKEVLGRLGLSTSSDKSRTTKGIATYFSKRCLPPEEKSINIPDSSPQPCSKTKIFHDDGSCSRIDIV